MHEIGLCEGLLAVALEAAGGMPVTRVRVRHGRRHGIVPESMELAWRLVSEGTPAERSTVELSAVPVRVRCRDCGAESEPADGMPACSRCEGANVELLAGDELVVVEVELADGTVRRNPHLVVAAAAQTEER